MSCRYRKKSRVLLKCLILIEETYSIYIVKEETVSCLENNCI